MTHPVTYEQVGDMLRSAFAGGVTPEFGTAKTWMFDARPPRYGRKWMTKRADRWKRRNGFDAPYTIVARSRTACRECGVTDPQTPYGHMTSCFVWRAQWSTDQAKVIEL